MFFNFIGHSPSVDNIIERLFTFVDSPRERPWVAMGALGIFILLGAVWMNQAQVLPGVSVSETGLSGSVADIMWGEDGDQALALVENGNDLDLMVRDSEGTWSALECGCNVTAIGGTESQWLAGGEDGWIGLRQEEDLGGLQPELQLLRHTQHKGKDPVKERGIRGGRRFTKQAASATIPLMKPAADREKIRSLDRPALEVYQLERLNQLLREVLPQNKFYAKKLSGLKSPIERISDLSKLPFTSKEELVGDDPHGCIAGCGGG